MTEVQELEAEIEDLSFQRTQAREACAEDPKQQLAEELRKEVVRLKLSQEPYAQVEAERNLLVAEIHEAEWALGKRIADLRRDLRDLKMDEAMAKYEAMTDHQLELAAGEAGNALAAARATRKAIRRVQDARITESAAKRLLSQMGPEQKAALLAELQGEVQ